MEILWSNPAYAWIAAGAALAVFEAFTMPGLGLFLAGLGAICTGILVQLNAIGRDDTALQFACFFGLTVVWAIALWKPLKKMRTVRKQSAGFSNVLGETAIVGKGGLTRGRAGQAIWSGTVMNAELAASASVESVAEGATVTIASVEGNTLKVIPK